jgi:hypothetical protein
MQDIDLTKIGEPKRHITVEPLPIPRKDPKPAPTPKREPAKEPARREKVPA